MVLKNGDEVSGFAAFRRCRHGAKIGPLQATSEADALSLLGANPFAGANEPIYVDVQDEGSPLSQLLQKLGFAPTFKTARMYKGSLPEAESTRYQAIATMELG